MTLRDTGSFNGFFELNVQKKYQTTRKDDQLFIYLFSSMGKIRKAVLSRIIVRFIKHKDWQEG